MEWPSSRPLPNAVSGHEGLPGGWDAVGSGDVSPRSVHAMTIRSPAGVKTCQRSACSRAAGVPVTSSRRGRGIAFLGSGGAVVAGRAGRLLAGVLAVAFGDGGGPAGQQPERVFGWGIGLGGVEGQ